MTPRPYSIAWTATAVTVLGLGTFISLLVLPAGNVLSMTVGVLALTYLGERLTGSGLTPEQLERLLLRLVIGLGACLGIVGLVHLLGPGAVPPLVLLAAVSPQVIAMAAPYGRVARSRITGSAATAPTAASLARVGLRVPDAVRTVDPSWTDAELCQAWRLSFLALERCDDLDRVTQLVEARQGYLDELERRHPVGFARWLYVGARPASDPSRYLTDTKATSVPNT